jgi:transposase-like protein
MKVRRSREWWRRTVARQVASGLSVSEFASGEGLVASTLRWWTSELRRSRAVTDPVAGFVEVVRAPRASEVLATGAEPSTDDEPRPAGVAIRVGPGVTLMMGSLPLPEYIARLAAAYEGQRP